jgi:hypothetical protein
MTIIQPRTLGTCVDEKIGHHALRGHNIDTRHGHVPVDESGHQELHGLHGLKNADVSEKEGVRALQAGPRLQFEPAKQCRSVQIVAACIGDDLQFLERTTGFEPATLTLAR